MYIKGKGFIKGFLFIFIAIAVYVGNKEFFNKITEKVKSATNHSEIQPSVSEDFTKEEDPGTLDFKFSTEDKSSFIGNFVSGTLNKILETPKGRGVVRGVLQKMMRQSQEIIGQDLFLSRYLTQDIIVGKGKKATCGDRVNILYNVGNLKNNDSKIKKINKEITIGSGTIGINLENGIIGMQEGGKRSVMYPSSMKISQVPAQKKKQQAISSVINLLSIRKRNKSNQHLGKPFFDKVEEENITSIKLICGDVIKGSYVISDLKGNVLYDSEKAGRKFSFRIGEHKIPVELSNAVIGLPIHKATVSFVTSPSHIRNSFSEVKNFIPAHIYSKKTSHPVILFFKLAVHNKI